MEICRQRILHNGIYGKPLIVGKGEGIEVVDGRTRLGYNGVPAVVKVNDPLDILVWLVRSEVLDEINNRLLTFADYTETGRIASITIFGSLETRPPPIMVTDSGAIDLVLATMALTMS